MFRDSQGRTWFKGNLHMHTKESDGAYTPEEAFEKYLENGYDFVARTDHWKVSEPGEYKGMLLLSGCEYNVGATPAEGVYHILAIGAEKEMNIVKSRFTASDSIEEPDSRAARSICAAQEIIDEIHNAGGLAALAHPAWSLNSEAQVASLRDIDFIEIYNSVSGLPRNARPYSGVLLDTLASRGHFYPLAATDDTHFYMESDTCRSYIMVQAEECTRDALIRAMKEGKYYASQGPILDVQWKEGKMIVHTSEVEEIVYYTDSVWTPHRADVGHDLTYGEYEPAKLDTYVRVEVKDKHGNYAWSQYYIVKKS